LQDSAPYSDIRAKIPALLQDFAPYIATSSTFLHFCRILHHTFHILPHPQFSCTFAAFRQSNLPGDGGVEGGAHRRTGDDLTGGADG
ncbi:hypothetical protein, partial [Paenibacillus cisolokensis]|uniref:hypothetical protein n=1 Tax=Paenibacillus cisolokensis TaxID=1658519 RepID=UPI001BCEE3B1